MLLRGGRSEQANLFLGLRLPAPDPGRVKMRVRLEAAITRRQYPLQGGRYARQSIASSEGNSGSCCADPVRRIRALRLRAHYSLVSGDSLGEKYFVIQPFGSNDLLVEATYENDNVYLLARKQAKGTYRILPIDQNDVDEATRIRTCVTRNPIICMIQTRQQLDTFVRAAAAETGGYIMIGVVSAAAR